MDRTDTPPGRGLTTGGPAGSSRPGLVAAILIGVLTVMVGVLRATDSKPALPNPQGAVAMQSGPGEYTISFVHPAWGPVKLLTHQNTDDEYPGPASLTVTDASGATRFSWEHNFLYSFGPAGTSRSASPQDRVGSPVDRLGHIFLRFDPGRYNGVIVLVPTEAGFEDLQTLPPYDDYQTRFYCAGAADLNHDDVYEVVEPEFCGGNTYRWRGTDYVED